MARLAHCMDRTALTNTFTCETSAHSYSIKWCSIGDARSPPLVFVHGTPWSSRVWAAYALTLSRRFRVYLFDNPGFGESPLGAPLPGKEDAVTDAAALDADLAEQSLVFARLYGSWEQDWHGRRAHVVAHDHAGVMSLRANLLHGCDYASLCLVDVVAIGPFGKPLFRLVADNRAIFEQLPAATFEGILRGYIKDAAHHPVSPEDMEMLTGPWLTEGGKERFIRQLCQANSRSTDGLEGRYHEVGAKMPVKIIWGAEDKWIPVEAAHRLAEALKTSDVTIVEDAGHLIMLDQGEMLGTEFGWWLAKVSEK